MSYTKYIEMEILRCFWHVKCACTNKRPHMCCVLALAWAMWWSQSLPSSMSGPFRPPTSPTYGLVATCISLTLSIQIILLCLLYLSLDIQVNIRNTNQLSLVNYPYLDMGKPSSPTRPAMWVQVTLKSEIIKQMRNRQTNRLWARQASSIIYT